MKIIGIEKHILKNVRDIFDEWESQIDLDLLLDEKYEFDVLGNIIKIDRIKLTTRQDYGFYKDLMLIYANKDVRYDNLIVQFDSYPVILPFLRKEEASGGILQDWCISEELENEWIENSTKEENLK